MEFGSTVALLFASSVVPTVPVLFVLAMLAFAVAFMLFLLEVLIGTAYLSRSRARQRRGAAPLQRAPGREIKGI
jgi:hypothetical protein